MKYGAYFFCTLNTEPSWQEKYRFTAACGFCDCLHSTVVCFGSSREEIGEKWREEERTHTGFRQRVVFEGLGERVEKERERRRRARREIDVIFEFFQSRLSLALSSEMMMPKFPLSAQKERRRRRKRRRKRTALAFTNHPNFCSSPSSAGGTWYPNSASNASSSRAISKGVFVVIDDDALLFVGPFPP